MKSSNMTFIAAALVVAALVACGEKKQAERKIAPPVTPVADTTVSAPVGTIVEPQKPGVVVSPEGEFTVQVSSWRTLRKAEKEAQRFRQHGYDAYVQRAYVADREEIWYRVRTGRYASAAAAAGVAGELRALLESGYWIDRVRQDASDY